MSASTELTQPRLHSTPAQRAVQGPIGEGSWMSGPYRPLTDRALFAQVCLGLTAVVVAALGLQLVEGFRFLDDLAARRVTQLEVMAWATRVDEWAALAVLCYIPTSIAFLAWLAGAVRNVPALGRGTPRWSPFASVVWWFVPIALFIMPPVIVWDVMKRVVAWASPALVVAWWVSFVGGSLVARFANTSGSLWIDDPRLFIGVSAASSAVTVGAAILAISIVRRIDAASARLAQAERREIPVQESVTWRETSETQGADVDRLEASAGLIVEWEASPDSKRGKRGSDGEAPFFMRLEAGSREDALRRLQELERREHAQRSYRVVEAAWAGATDPTILVAMGEPDKTYDLVAPGRPRVRWASPLDGPTPQRPPHPHGRSAGIPTTAQPDVPEPRAAATEAAVRDVSGDSTLLPGQPTPAGAPGDGLTVKTCPDCAESVLAAARICRYCRYEFRPAAVDAPLL